VKTQKGGGKKKAEINRGENAMTGSECKLALLQSEKNIREEKIIIELGKRKVERDRPSLEGDCVEELK